MGERKRISANQRKGRAAQRSIAKLLNVPTSPRKMRLVADMVRGQEVGRALGILHFSNKEAAQRLKNSSAAPLLTGNRKTSARPTPANYISALSYVNCAPMLKRLRTAPSRPRLPIRKRSNHVTVVVDTIANKNTEA